MVSGDLAPGLRRLAREYEFVRELGRGGMASVYLAMERASGRLVAIKAIDRRYAEDRDALARFAREARTVADLDHPNVVRTYAVEPLGDETLAIIMQHVPGGTLRDTLRVAGALSFERAVAVLRDVAEALRYAHARGLVHRDVKPENVFLHNGSGRALLSDFGIARMMEEDSRLTLTGAALGTPAYMSPEQIDGRPLDGRSDIYSLGLVGWEMLAGRQPWEGDSLYSVIYKQKHEELPRLTTLRPDVPEPLLFAIEGALHKHRETRWADAAEFLAQLLERPEPTAAPEVTADEVAAPAVTEDEPARATPPVAAAADLDLPPPVEETDPHEPPAQEPLPEQEGAALVPVEREPDALPPDALATDDVPPPPHGGPRTAARLVVPLALALLAALVVGEGRRAHQRPAAAAGRDSSAVTTSSTGALDDSASMATPPADTPRAETVARDGPAVSEAGAEVRRSARRALARARPRTQPQGGAEGPPLAAHARTRGDSLKLCGSPVTRDQRACLLAAVADNDVGLNNVYNTLIKEMRRQAGASAGSPDPAPVVRLRAEQRAWLGERDQACARRLGGQDGRLWAVPRAHCLGQLSSRRAGVLADRLTRLRAP